MNRGDHLPAGPGPRRRWPALASCLLLAGVPVLAQDIPVQGMPARNTPPQAAAPTAAPVPAAPTAAAATAAPRAAAIQGDASCGKTLYQACTSCHSIDDDDIGPRHRGVVGRKAGTVPGYAYSAALKASGIVWDRETLDRWLTNPSAMVPGTRMFFLIDNPQSRADIIAYLSELR